MLLSRNIWKKWGLKCNPFDTKALTLYSDILPISRAFVGRSVESSEFQHLLSILKNSGGGRGIVEGDIGVGKTTLVNYQRFLWEHEAEEKLFTHEREISVYGKWECKDLLIEILGHLSNKLLKILKQKKINKNKLVKKIQSLYDIFYNESFDFGGSVFGFGFNYKNDVQINIPNITESQLISYLMDMVYEIKKLGYDGVFLHFDNLELLARRDFEKCQQLFEEIRDILQLPDIYYIFVAKKGFYSQIIAPLERVRSIIGWPVKVSPLSCKNVIKAINIRYELLAQEATKPIKPVSDFFIEKLYKIYQGKIRFIMDSISQIMLFYKGTKKNMLKDKEAEKLFFNIVNLKTECLSPREKEVLTTILEFDEFTNDFLAKRLKMKRPNISQILKKLEQENFIYFLRSEGRRYYYSVIDEFKVLIEFQKKEKTILQNKMNRDTKSDFLKKLKKQDRYEKLFTYFLRHKKINRIQYENLIGASSSTASRDLANLVRDKKIAKKGNGKKTYYVLIRKILNNTSH
mgnify:CR=1 FL=1